MSGQGESARPHDIEAEQAVLGGLMMGASLRSCDLAAADFYRAAHQLIYEAIESLDRQGKPRDAIAVKDELRSRSQLTKIKGADYLQTCLAAVPSVAQTPYYAEIVRQHAERRLFAEHAERVRQAALDPGTQLDDLRDLAAKQAEHAARPGLTGSGDRRVVLTPAAQIPPRPSFWGWQDRMPAGHLTLIPGREGIGKSLLLIWLTSQITRGTLPGVYFGAPRRVFYCATEDSWQHTIIPRLIAAGADLDLVYRVEVEAIATSMRIDLTMPRDCDLLAAEVKRLEVAMVALDPMMSVIDRTVDTYNDRDMRTVLEPLSRLADDTGCMIVGLAHFNKTATDDPLTLVTGSRAFTAVVRAVIAVARDPEAENGACVVSQVKNNLGRLDLPNLTYLVGSAIVETPEGDTEVGRLYFTGESERSVRDILAEAGDGVERGLRIECINWLREALANGPVLTKEIEADGHDRGFSQRTQWRARKKLGVQAEQISSGPKGKNEWWLSLPAEGRLP